MRRILLYDSSAAVHTPGLVRRLVRVLAHRAEPIVAIAEGFLGEVADLGAKLVPLEPLRPPTGHGEMTRAAWRTLGEADVRSFRRVAADVGADLAVNLFADRSLGQLARAERFPCRVGVLVFHPRAHYPRAYRSPLTLWERREAWRRERVLARWRVRRDAHTALGFDEEAVRRWSRLPGAPVHWLPEPPVDVAVEAVPDDARAGCVLYGILDRRKGVHLLARALSVEETPLHLVLAGAPGRFFEDELRRRVAAMAAAGVAVDLRASRQEEAVALRLLAGARCAVLPYPRHFGMSRVLLEAATVGTPVVAQDFGLLGHLVRAYGLGLLVDARDPRALRRAILELVEDPGRAAEFRAGQERFVARHSQSRFESAVRAAFGTG